jgi:hypothetical protein
LTTRPHGPRLTVDGETFDVTYDPEQPGTYHYAWLSGPNPGYGFSSRRSDHTDRETVAEHEAAIRDFLVNIDPATGYLGPD